MTDVERDEDGEANAGGTRQHSRTPQEEPDIHNFSTSSSHRLVTISGTQALQNELGRARGITTSLPSLDASLVPTGSNLPSSGIRPGYVTEIYGPPGVGKTTFGIQLASNVLHSIKPDAKAVWLNTGSALVHSRLASIISSYTFPSHVDPPSSPPRLQPLDAFLARFVYHEIVSLPHLLTLIMHPTAIFPPSYTTLLVIDDLSNLIFSSLPHPAPANKSDPVASAVAKRESARRIQIVESLSSALSSLAASRHIAIVILNKCTTAQRPGSQAVLKPALAGQAWDPGIYARIVLYQDFPSWDVRDKLSESESQCWRLAEVVRLGNKDVVRSAIAFVIDEAGMREIVSGQQSDGKGKGKLTETEAPEATLPATMPLSQLPPIEDEEEPEEEEQLVERGEPDPENLGPGLEEEPDLPPPVEEGRAQKRKATEIADSEDEVEGGSVDSDNEPDLPRILSAREMHDEASEEMLLDEHERQMTQRNFG